MVSGKGIKPLPEKLESVKKMPAPTTPKEIKQFLGLVGYYRKFIPRFADIARPMTNLTKQDVSFEWNLQCQASFEILKDALITSPILKYPDQVSPTHYSLMQANMLRLVYSLKSMNMRKMGRSLKLTIQSFFQVAYSKEAN